MPYKAKQAFRPSDRYGRGVIVNPARVYADDDPLVVDHLHLFVEVDEVVERATAAPGERRTAGHPCDECDFVSKTAAGLGAHQRSHNDGD